MDFALTEEQQAIVGLSAQILTDRCTQEHLKEVEAGTEWFDRETWLELAKSELLGIALPEAVGGGGFGFLEACLVLQEAGRNVAPLPLWSTFVGAAAIAEFGSASAIEAAIPSVIDGRHPIALALSEIAAPLSAPALLVDDLNGDVVLNGSKTNVAYAHVAGSMIVTGAGTDGTLRAFVVATNAPGLRIERQDTFNHEPRCEVSFTDVSVGAANELRGENVVSWIVDRGVVAVCALAAGVADGGMKITASYVSTRQQFDRPIGSFQAVGHRMADCFVDVEAMKLSMLLAGSRLAQGKPADKDVAVAKYWASYSGSRVGHAGLHLHGGISIDLDYPIHRHFLWAKELELTLEGAAPQLAHLGSMLAAEPVGSV